MTRLALLILAGAALLAAAPPASLPDAAEARESAAIHELLASGADPNARQPDGMTALHWAVHHDDRDAVSRLIQAGADITLTNRYGVPPLHLAAINGDASIVEALLEAGADPNTRVRGGETVLMTAARTGRLPAVRLLLSRGADPNAQEETQRQTALMWAAAEGHSDVVALLIEYGAKPTKLDSGYTPFLFAVREGRLETVRTLLDLGADANETFERDVVVRRAPAVGTSALLLAVQNAHYELASLLLDAGADPNADRVGYTALHAIPSVRNPGIGDNDPPPVGFGSVSSLDFVRKLIESGADINARMTKKVNLGVTILNKMGATPFFLAAQSADVELLRTLAELGADQTITNEDGSTPLLAAAGLGTRSPGEDAGTEEEVLAALAFLLEQGADINIVDNKEETVIHAAAYKNLPRVVEYLAAQGADPELWSRPNASGWTPLKIAEGFRFGNFKPSQVTIAAVEKVMLDAGLVPERTDPAERMEQNAEY